MKYQFTPGLAELGGLRNGIGILGMEMYQKIKTLHVVMIKLVNG
ncbi:MAG: hypothetical protein ACJAWO_002310 [Halieaceae bacterium]|jgi:hypothetical protein